MEEKAEEQKSVKKSGGLFGFLRNLFKKESNSTSSGTSSVPDGEEKPLAAGTGVSPVQNSENKTHTEQEKDFPPVENSEDQSSAGKPEYSVQDDEQGVSVEETVSSDQNIEEEEPVETSVQNDEMEVTVNENAQTTKEADVKRNEELKKLSRLELIEIIYKLKKSEEYLQEENEELRNSLDEKVLCMNKAGSIAEAVVGLNQIFEVAQRTADEYIQSVQRSYSEENGINPQAEIDSRIQDAQRKADEILTQAQQKADEILLSARQEAEKESGEILARAQQEADKHLEAVMESAKSKASQESTAMIEQARQEAERLKAEFYEEVRMTLRQYPELAKRMRG